MTDLTREEWKERAERAEKERPSTRVASIGTCSRCGYCGPGPAHDCAARLEAERDRLRADLAAERERREMAERAPDLDFTVVAETREMEPYALVHGGKDGDYEVNTDSYALDEMDIAGKVFAQFFDGLALPVKAGERVRVKVWATVERAAAEQAAREGREGGRT